MEPGNETRGQNRWSELGLEHGDIQKKAVYKECSDTPGSNPRECDDRCEQGRSVSNLRQLELVWSPWAGPGTCQVDISSKGVVSAQPEIKHQQDQRPL
jgi:hypothetical protein